MTHEQAQSLLREAGSVLSRCHQDFEAGRAVDVLPMERIVRDFCAAIQAMPKEEAKLYEEPLNVMLEGLEALELMLSRRREELRRQVQGLNASQKAQTAYTRFPAGSADKDG
jgi:hypothetical protein